jgi:hypothetical protein
MSGIRPAYPVILGADGKGVPYIGFGVIKYDFGDVQTPASERVNEFMGTSFRGAGTARESGTQAHGVLRYRQDVVFIGSGPAKGRPGMTGSQLRQFRHTGLRRDGLRFHRGSRPTSV